MVFKGFNIGGHGIYSGIGYSSYTLSGNKVLLLPLNNNKKIYIGTQRAEVLLDFLEKLNAERK